MAQYTGMTGYGSLAARPAAYAFGRMYYVTDAGAERWSYDSGSAWANSYVSLDYVTTGTRVKIDAANGAIGINTAGTPNTYEALFIESGNVYLQSANEQSFAIKRVSAGMAGGRLGDSVLGPRNPVWTFGRVIASPPLYKAEWRWLYSDDDTSERAVISMESTGTIAGIRVDDGSFFEGFISGESVPMYRLNSSPRMGLEFGEGGSSNTDVGLRRRGAGVVTVDSGQAADGGGALEFVEIADIAAGGTNTGRLYVRDTGGKSQLVVRFNSGAIQVIATEP